MSPGYLNKYPEASDQRPVPKTVPLVNPNHLLFKEQSPFKTSKNVLAANSRCEGLSTFKRELISQRRNSAHAEPRTLGLLFTTTIIILSCLLVSQINWLLLSKSDVWINGAVRELGLISRATSS